MYPVLTVTGGKEFWIEEKKDEYIQHPYCIFIILLVRVYKFSKSKIVKI